MMNIVIRETGAINQAPTLCGCCEGVAQLTPTTIANRPGLSTLAYRVGIQATFLETMLARLSNMGIPLGELNTILADPSKADELQYPLNALTTRATDDLSIALLDAWAVLADVLSFYQERIANEGYLRTATERRSLIELARLVDYTLRPGVAASVFLSYTLENGRVTTIPMGSRAQSIPGPGQLPQSFETSFDITARGDWNAIQPRMSVPQYISQLNVPSGSGTIPDTTTIYTDTPDGALYLAGTATNLKTNDPLLFAFDDSSNRQVFGLVKSVDPHPAQQYTKVLFPAEFTPTVFFENLQDTLQTYQDTVAFGVNKDDPIVANIVQELKVVQSLVQTDEPGGLDQFSYNDTAPYYSDLQQTTDDLRGLCFIYDRCVASGSTDSGTVDPTNDGLASGLQRLIPNLPVDTTLWVDTVRQIIKTGQSRPTQLASWIGGIINDVSGQIYTITDFRSELFRSKSGGTYPVCTPTVTTSIASLVSPLAKPPSLQPANSARLRRDIKQAFARKADIAPQIITVLNPAVESTLYDALSHANVTQSPPLQDVYALRVKATPFGSNAPLKAHTTHHPAVGSTPETFTIDYEDWKLDDSGQEKPDATVLDLDARYDQILPGSWVVIDYTDTTTSQLICKVKSVRPYVRAGFGMSAKVTRLTLDQDWRDSTNNDLKPLRGVTIYAQSEKLTRTDEFIDDDVSGSDIELDDLYDGLQSGQWVVVSGERTDIPNTSGIKTSELVLLASVTQEVRTVQIAPDPAQTSRPFIQLPGDKTHTVLHFAPPPLTYTYKRATAAVNANVVKATQGETRMEVLGSGNGSVVMQQFTLKQAPLTYVSAATSAGAASTLQVYVNDVQWHEVESLDAQGPKAHVFITKTDDADKTTITFGNGQQHGARPPTGVENIKALYRIGIGTPGNVDAGQISLLATRPLGVKGVLNPKSATGGADRESILQARRNVPLATQALSRIVSVQDYADFARTFAGIGKANVLTLPTINRQLVHLTIAGQDNIPIDPTSDLYQNLFLALRTFGNPSEPLQLGVCETKLLVLSLRVRILPDYMLETVAPAIRAALLDAFSFEQRDLGQPVYESEVFSVVQQVPGVSFVDLDILDAVDQPKLLNALDVIHQQELQAAVNGVQPNETQDMVKLLNLQVRQIVLSLLARTVRNQPGIILPAQLVFLSSDVPDTLIINELTSTHVSLKSKKRR